MTCVGDHEAEPYYMGEINAMLDKKIKKKNLTCIYIEVSNQM